MLKHVAMKITVGYSYSKTNKQSLLNLFFLDWLYNNCSVSVNEDEREFTVSEEEYIWLVFAFPATTVSKYVSIDFDNYKKEQRNGHTYT